MVTRYDVDGDGCMDPYEDGPWVLYDDYQAQAARIGQLEAALETARNDALREAADVVENLWAYRTCREVVDAILALITKEAP